MYGNKNTIFVIATALGGVALGKMIERKKTNKLIHKADHVIGMQKIQIDAMNQLFVDLAEGDVDEAFERYYETAKFYKAVVKEY